MKDLGFDKKRTVGYKLLQYLGISLVLILTILYSFHIMTPTTKKNNNSGYKEMMSHLDQIAKEPHESGSSAIEDVRNYLTNQFDSMKTSYEVYPFERDGIEFVNYLVKLDAPNTDDSVMFVSHYDSVSRGPGACDDGVSVASMLTTLRETKDRQQSKNDMYFLFTDGEELGLYGANDFLEKYHEDYKDTVKLVVNLEARGTCGSLLMFETSNHDKNLVRMLKKAIPSGLTAFSFAAAAYKTMDNDTDLSEFLSRGYTGINFAVVDGGENYHTEYDNIHKLDKNTAYMYYKTTSELADYVESINLDKLQSKEDGVYFPYMKGRNVVFSDLAIKIVGVLSILAWLGIMVFACIKKKLRVKKVLTSALVVVINMACSYVVVRILNVISQSKYESMEHTFQTVVSLRSSTLLWQIAVMLVICTIVTALLNRFLGNIVENLFVISTLVVVVQIVLYFTLTGVIYLTTIPLILLDIFMIISILAKESKRSVIIYILSLFVIFIIGILVVPVLRTVFSALLIGESYLTTGVIFGLLEAFFFTLSTLMVEKVDIQNSLK